MHAVVKILVVEVLEVSMSAGGISHARDKDCVSRSNVCGAMVLFVDEFIVFRISF